MLTERALALKVGDGLKTGVDMGPSVNEDQMNTVLEYVEIGKGEGARLAAGGRRLGGKA